MTKMKQILTAALAVAALGTASIAASTDADARGRGGHHGGHHGGAKFFHGGGKHFGGHHFRHRNHFRYGYAYNSCWKYTPYGLVNVCKVWY
jgi:opacity protein-like surface antigen